MLLLGWYDVAAMSNQRWNNVAYSNIEIYYVEQRQNNVVYLNFDINNFRKRRNDTVFFNVEFHNVDQRRKNIVKMTIFKRMKRAKEFFFELQKRWIIWLTTVAFDCDQLKWKENMERTM